MLNRRQRTRYSREVWMRMIDNRRMRRARKRKGFAQRDLAALCKCTQATISALETGAMTGCSVDLAEALAKWLDVDVEDFFERHEHTRLHRVINASGRTRQERAA